MLNKKIFLGVIAGMAALGFSSMTFANGDVGMAPTYIPTHVEDTDAAGIYLGVQGGYALTHWDNIEPLFAPGSSIDDGDGFAGRAYMGYAFNKYFAVEGGWTYLPSVDVNVAGMKVTSIDNWAVDLVAKLMVPFDDQFGLFTTIGGNYFRSDDSLMFFTTGAVHDTENFNVTYGGGAYYNITPNFSLDVAWKRFDGHPRITDDYQPNPDLFTIGVAYKFPISLA